MPFLACDPRQAIPAPGAASSIRKPLAPCQLGANPTHISTENSPSTIVNSPTTFIPDSQSTKQLLDESELNSDSGRNVGQPSTKVGLGIVVTVEPPAEDVDPFFRSGIRAVTPDGLAKIRCEGMGTPTATVEAREMLNARHGTSPSVKVDVYLSCNLPKNNEPPDEPAIPDSRDSAEACQSSPTSHAGRRLRRAGPDSLSRV